MKKIIALLLAALMLLGMTAMAETAEDYLSKLPPALISNLNNVKLTLVTENGTQTVALDDFNVMFAINTANDTEITTAAYKGEEALAFSVIRITGDKVQVSIGDGKCYEVEIPEQYAAQLESVLPSLRAILPMCMGMNLPIVDAIPFPKLDMTMLVGAFSTGTEGNVTTFEIPEAIVNMIVEQVAAAAENAGQQAGPMSGFVDMIESFRNSGMGISLQGTLTDNVDEQIVETGVFISADGVPAETPAFVVTTTSYENEFYIVVAMPNGDEMMNVSETSLITDASSNSTSLKTDVMGMISSNVTLSAADNEQDIALTFDMLGSELNINLSYGKAEDTDFTEVSVDAFGTKIECAASGKADENGYGGSAQINVDASTANFELTSDYTEYLGEYDSGYEMPSETAPISELTNEKMQEAMKPLTDYFTQMFTPAAA